MSQSSVSEFSTAPIEPAEVDLLARLYHEIGVSAVAAALEILNAPTQASKRESSAFDGRYLPTSLEDHLAA